MQGAYTFNKYMINPLYKDVYVYMMQRITHRKYKHLYVTEVLCITDHASWYIVIYIGRCLKAIKNIHPLLAERY